MSTGARTLALLALLQSRRYWAGPELAARLEVSARTLRRDVERLRELGYPVTAARGVDGGYQLAPGASLPPLVLDDDEAVALAVGLSAAASSAVTGMAESSVSALAKVVQVLPPRLRRRVEALNAATTTQAWGSAGGSVDAQVLTALAQTCRDGERVAFGYTAASGDRTERAVEPLQLVPVGRRWYLVGYDLDRGDWRSFRLDRVTQARSTGVQFRPRELPGGDPLAFVQAGRSRWPGPYAVEVRVAAPVTDVRARIGRWADVQPDAGGCVVRMTTDQLDWPILALSMVDADFAIVGPPELLEHARRLAVRLERSVRRGDDLVMRSRGRRGCSQAAAVKEAESRTKNQAAPPRIICEALQQPDRDPHRLWLELSHDEVRPEVLQVDAPHLVLWSSLWPAWPGVRIRFDLPDDGRGGTDLRWTLLCEGPPPGPHLLRHMRKRLNQLVNANLRYSFGS